MKLTIICTGSTIARVEKNYLQPAALSLRAYILPISPRPMMPIANSWEVMVAVLEESS